MRCMHDARRDGQRDGDPTEPVAGRGASAGTTRAARLRHPRGRRRADAGPADRPRRPARGRRGGAGGPRDPAAPAERVLGGVADHRQRVDRDRGGEQRVGQVCHGAVDPPRVTPFPRRRVRVVRQRRPTARRSRGPAPSQRQRTRAVKLPESLRASPPTETTVGEPDGSSDAAGVIRSHTRRRRTPSEPIRPTTIATAAISR